MRTVLIAALLLILPATLFAIPSIGIYFAYNPTNPGQAHYSPALGETFNGYVYVHNWGCLLTAIEFAVTWPEPCIIFGGWSAPEGYLNQGSLPDGVSITWWPPVSDYEYPYHLVATIQFFASCTCVYYGGSLVDMPMQVIPDPGAIPPGEVWGTCAPENDLIPFLGETSIICPDLIATEEQSWGAIKSLLE
ncbi:MAG: hypothetical protein JSV33_11965 [bacterium]|nr:MAG: hypothetical protein JSV33_11965 [bacterium]